MAFRDLEGMGSATQDAAPEFVADDPDAAQAWADWATRRMEALEKELDTLRESFYTANSQIEGYKRQAEKDRASCLAYEQVIKTRQPRTVYEPGTEVYTGPGYSVKADVLSLTVGAGGVRYRLGWWIERNWVVADDVPEGQIVLEPPLLDTPTM